MSNTALIVNEGEGEKLWFAGGGLLTMKATAEQTNGTLTMLEDRVVRGKTTPLHVHKGIDELVYVLDGELLVHLDGKEYVVRKGGMYFAPRGRPHAFLVTSETAHLLVVQTPGAGEAFYRDAGEPSTSAADANRPPDFARLQRVAAASPHIELLGPPPFK